VYRVATNSLLDTRRARPDRTFEEFGAQIDGAVAAYSPERAPETAAVIDEAKLVCTQGMLACLDRAHRLAFILGEILELPGEEAAAILEITPAAFRKRLSRARDDMTAFLTGRCGLADPANACRCHKLAPAAVAAGIVDPTRLTMSRQATRKADELRVDVERLRSAVELFRSLPIYAAGTELGSWITTLLD
jgi:sigma-70-like protein